MMLELKHKTVVWATITVYETKLVWSHFPLDSSVAHLHGAADSMVQKEGHFALTHSRRSFANMA